MPAIGYGLYTPVRVTRRPLVIEVRNMPSTMGSRCSPEAVGDRPWTIWRNSGRNAIEPIMAKPTHRLMPMETTMVGSRNRPSGMTGSGALRAVSHHPIPKITPAADRPMICHDDHEWTLPPQEATRVRHTAVAAIRTMPA